MRVIAITAILSVCLAGATLAQSGNALVFTPTWEIQPTSEQNVTHYPRQALARNISGLGVVCCTPRADRSLDCTIKSEWPEGEGFGAATQRASQAYRLSPQSTLDLERRPGTQIRLSMIWAGAVITDETRDRLLNMDQETLEACLAPAS